MQQELFLYFNKYYYASNMKLVIASSKDVPTLIKLVSSLFSKIKDKHTIQNKLEVERY